MQNLAKKVYKTPLITEWGFKICNMAFSNRLPDLVPLIPNIRNVLGTITLGQVIEIGDS
jgi:hypothetical protein